MSNKHLYITRIYITLKGVNNSTIVKPQFKSQAFDVKIENVNNQHYRFGMDVFAKIDTEKSKVIKKNDSIVIKLIKDEKKTWDQLQKKKPSAFEQMPKKDQDPAAGLMDLMKKMYEEGDDEMKRTIAKAWVCVIC